MRDDSSTHSESKTRLDELARRFYAPLISFFHKRIRSTTEVHDLVQQVFLRLAQHGTLSIEHADGYIFQTAANTLKDHFRRELLRERFAKNPRDYIAGPDSELSVERVLESREALGCVAEVLRKLPERTRDVVVLRCFEGLKYAEIAKLHGISVRAVEKHMAKALNHMSLALDLDEVVRPPQDGRLGKGERSA